MNGVSKTLREFSCMVHAQVSDCMSDSIVILTIQWRDDFRCWPEPCAGGGWALLLTCWPWAAHNCSCPTLVSQPGTQEFFLPLIQWMVCVQTRMAENRLKQYWQVTPCSSVGVLSNTGTATGKCGVLRFGDVCRISLRVIDLAGFTISIIRFWMQLLLQWNLITGWIFTKPDYGGVFWSKYCILRVASQSASSE